MWVYRLGLSFKFIIFMGGRLILAIPTPVISQTEIQKLEACGPLKNLEKP